MWAHPPFLISPSALWNISLSSFFSVLFLILLNRSLRSLSSKVTRLLEIWEMFNLFSFPVTTLFLSVHCELWKVTYLYINIQIVELHSTLEIWFIDPTFLAHLLLKYRLHATNRTFTTADITVYWCLTLSYSATLHQLKAMTIPCLEQNKCSLC